MSHRFVTDIYIYIYIYIYKEKRNVMYRRYVKMWKKDMSCQKKRMPYYKKDVI